MQKVIVATAAALLATTWAIGSRVASATEDCPRVVVETSVSTLVEEWFVTYTLGSRPGRGTKRTGWSWGQTNPDPESPTCGERFEYDGDIDYEEVAIPAVTRAAALARLTQLEAQLEAQEGYECSVADAWDGGLRLSCSEHNSWSDYPEEDCRGNFTRTFRIIYAPLEVVVSWGGTDHGPYYYLAEERGTEEYFSSCPCLYCVDPAPAPF